MSKQLRFPRINHVVISGRLTREVDLRYTASGTPVAKLSIASDRRVQRDGNWESEVSYFDVIAWDQKATSCAENLHKGNAVLVEGRLQMRTYTNNEGRNIKLTEIQSTYIHFLEWNDDTPRQSSGGDKFEESFEPASRKFKNEDTLANSENSTEDDVPF